VLDIANDRLNPFYAIEEGKMVDYIND